MRRPIGVDLFAGAGGLSLGFEQAGFDVVAAVEIDPIHASVHHFNFPNCTMIPLSVEQVTGDYIRKASNLGSKQIDVVFGGPPCQGFSLIGHRALDDPRNRLVREFVRLVLELDASYFVFENVKGLTVGRSRQILDEIITAFEGSGYTVLLPWKVLNAAHFAVPQDRQRLILFGAKKGRKLPSYPEQATCVFPEDIEGMPLCPTCFEALGDLPDAEDFDELLFDDGVETHSWGEPSAYARMLRCLDSASWRFGYKRRWNPFLLTCSSRTGHSDISRKRFKETRPGCVEPISRFFKLSSNGISNTLRAGTDSARGAFTSPRPIHYSKTRCITVREMARLHGYPDWFRLHSTKWHGARQIGNSVPPPLARAIASCLFAVLEVAPHRPRKTIDLGNPSLLHMDMSQAAQYWNVEVPIAKRDRKSGATKRKQKDIECFRKQIQAYAPITGEQ